MAEIVRRRSFGAVLPLGRQASISGSSLIQCASVSIALSSFQEGQNARHQIRFKLEQALARMRLQESIFDIYLSIMAMALAMLVSGFLKEEISRPLSLLLAAMIGVLTVAKPILRFADR